MSTFAQPHSAVTITHFLLVLENLFFSIGYHCVQMELMSMDIFSSLNKHNEALSQNFTQETIR